MAGVTRVKVCGLTRAEDVRLATHLGAWALGFILTPSPRQVDPPRAGGLAREARGIGSAAQDPPPGVGGPRVPPLSVGVFTTESPSWIAAALETSGLDAVQLSAGADGPAVAEVLAAVRGGRRPLVIAAADTPDASLADLVLVDARAPGSYGGTGRALDLRALDTDLALPRDRLVLAGGLTPGNAVDAVHTLRPAAVDVSSGVESAPGVKDRLLLREFFAAVEHADKDKPAGAQSATTARRTSG
jgi:phosphoribosylanthranilate isomerase